MKKSWNIIGMITGIAAVIFGVYLLASTSGDHYSSMISSYIKFGGDFYTEVYSAASRAANVLRFQYEMLRISISTAFILSGITQVCVFAGKLEKSPKGAQEKTPEAVSEEQ